MWYRDCQHNYDCIITGDSMNNNNVSILLLCTGLN